LAFLAFFGELDFLCRCRFGRF